MKPQELLNSWLGGKWEKIVVQGGELETASYAKGYVTPAIYVYSSTRWIEIETLPLEDEYGWDAEVFPLFIGVLDTPPIPEPNIRNRPPRKLLENHPSDCPINELCTDGIKKLITFGLETVDDRIIAGRSMTIECNTGHQFGLVALAFPIGNIEIRLVDGENRNGWAMELDDFAGNPIIDELIWVRETLGPVTKLVPKIDGATDCSVRCLGPNSLEHTYSLDAGCFAEWWSDAMSVLAREGIIEPLRDLKGHEREMLVPAEEEARRDLDRWHQERKEEQEKRRITRAIEEAGEAFRLKRYENVVTILAEYEHVLGGVILRKLTYARKKISSAPTLDEF